MFKILINYTCNYFTISRQYDESFQWSVNEALFKCVVENDLTGVKTYVEAGEDVNAVKEEVCPCFKIVITSLLYKGCCAMRMSSESPHVCKN